MKKRLMRKVAAAVSALCLTAAAAVPAMGGILSAYAADNGSIVIEKGNSTLQGKTFNVYQIFTAQAASNEVENEYDYATVEAWNDFFASNTYYNFNGADVSTDAKRMKWIVETFGSGTNVTSATKLQVFAAALKNYAEDKSIQPAKTVDASATDVPSVTIGGLANGYYLVVQTNDSGKGDAISAFMMDTVVDETVTITLKADAPSVDKWIWTDSETSEKAGEYDKNDDLAKANTAGYGDVVDYVIKASIPDMTNYRHYRYMIKDTLADGLEYVNGSIKVYIGDTLLEDEDGDGYTVETFKHKVIVTFDDLKGYLAAHPDLEGEEIVIVYEAKVTTDAIVGNTGNDNTVSLVYSNDPENSGYYGNGDDYEPDDPDTPDDTEGPDDPEDPKKPKDPPPEWPDNPEDPEDPDDPPGNDTEETPEHKTYTYVGEIKVIKVNGKGTALSGAEFQLEAVGDTTIYKATVSSDGKVVVSTDTADGTVTDIKAFVDNDGYLVFTGLNAGTYTLTETQEPTGYNRLEKPINIDLKCTIDENDPSKASWGADVTYNGADYDKKNVDSSDGTIKITVVNRSGALFPSTGGMGTTIFYAAGAAMMVGACALVLTKKRNAES